MALFAFSPEISVWLRAPQSWQRLRSALPVLRFQPRWATSKRRTCQGQRRCWVQACHHFYHHLNNCCYHSCYCSHNSISVSCVLTHPDEAVSHCIPCVAFDCAFMNGHL